MGKNPPAWAKSLVKQVNNNSREIGDMKDELYDPDKGVFARIANLGSDLRDLTTKITTESDINRRWIAGGLTIVGAIVILIQIVVAVWIKGG